MFGTPTSILTSQVRLYMLPAILEPVTIIDTSGLSVMNYQIIILKNAEVLKKKSKSAPLPKLTGEFTQCECKISKYRIRVIELAELWKLLVAYKNITNNSN